MTVRQLVVFSKTGYTTRIFEVLSYRENKYKHIISDSVFCGIVKLFLDKSKKYIFAACIHSQKKTT
jgi:hypothetical protein